MGSPRLTPKRAATVSQRAQARSSKSSASDGVALRQAVNAVAIRLERVAKVDQVVRSRRPIHAGAATARDRRWPR